MSVNPEFMKEGEDGGRKRFVARVEYPCTGMSVRVLGQVSFSSTLSDFVGYCHAELFHHHDGKRIWQSDLAHVPCDGEPTSNVVYLT